MESNKINTMSYIKGMTRGIAMTKDKIEELHDYLMLCYDDEDDLKIVDDVFQNIYKEVFDGK